MIKNKQITKNLIAAFLIAFLLMGVGFLIFRNTEIKDPDLNQSNAVNNLNSILDEINSVDLGKETDGFSELDELINNF